MKAKTKVKVQAKAQAKTASAPAKKRATVTPIRKAATATADAPMKPKAKDAAAKSTAGTPIPFIDASALIEDADALAQFTEDATLLVSLKMDKKDIELQIKALEASIGEALTSDRIKTEVDGISISKYPGHTTWIDKDTLLARGVEIDIIVEATKRSDFTRIDVKMGKE